MDVHPPHQPIHSAKEFFLHLFTITIGLLIAVGIEGIVEWRHHEHMVEVAKTALRAEAEYNVKRVQKALPALLEERKEVETSLAGLKKIQEEHDGKADQNVNLTAAYEIFELQDTAWRTAQSTGALGYMAYDEAQRYVEIYQNQESLAAAQTGIAEDAAAVLGLVAKFDIAGKPRITKDEASALAEPYGRWRSHLLYLNLRARLCAAQYQAFLSGKPAPKEMREDLNF